MKRLLTSLVLLVALVGQALAAPDIATNQELWLKLDETSGPTAADSSGNARDQTISGNPVFGTGQINNGLAFDGTGDYMLSGVQTLGSADLFFTSGQPHTIAFWLKSTSTGTVIAKAGGTAGSRTFQFFLDSGSNKPGLIIRGTTTSISDVAVDGSWHHWAITYDGTTCRLYRDGILRATPTVGSASEESENITIGCRTSGTPASPLIGSLDDLRLYARALTPVEVKALYDYPTIVRSNRAPYLAKLTERPASGQRIGDCNIHLNATGNGIFQALNDPTQAPQLYDYDFALVGRYTANDGSGVPICLVRNDTTVGRLGLFAVSNTDLRFYVPGEGITNDYFAVTMSGGSHETYLATRSQGTCKLYARGYHGDGFVSNSQAITATRDFSDVCNFIATGANTTDTVVGATSVGAGRGIRFTAPTWFIFERGSLAGLTDAQAKAWMLNPELGKEIRGYRQMVSYGDQKNAAGQSLDTYQKGVLANGDYLQCPQTGKKLTYAESGGTPSDNTYRRANMPSMQSGWENSHNVNLGGPVETLHNGLIVKVIACEDGAARNELWVTVEDPETQKLIRPALQIPALHDVINSSNNIETRDGLTPNVASVGDNHRIWMGVITPSATDPRFWVNFAAHSNDYDLGGGETGLASDRYHTSPQYWSLDDAWGDERAPVPFTDGQAYSVTNQGWLLGTYGQMAVDPASGKCIATHRYGGTGAGRTGLVTRAANGTLSYTTLTTDSISGVADGQLSLRACNVGNDKWVVLSQVRFFNAALDPAERSRGSLGAAAFVIEGSTVYGGRTGAELTLPVTSGFPATFLSTTTNQAFADANSIAANITNLEYCLFESADSFEYEGEYYVVCLVGVGPPTATPSPGFYLNRNAVTSWDRYIFVYHFNSSTHVLDLVRRISLEGKVKPLIGASTWDSGSDPGFYVQWCGNDAGLFVLVTELDGATLIDGTHTQLAMQQEGTMGHVFYIPDCLAHSNWDVRLLQENSLDLSVWGAGGSDVGLSISGGREIEGMPYVVNWQVLSLILTSGGNASCGYMARRDVLEQAINAERQGRPKATVAGGN